jgi:hypothetical protein
MTFMKSNFVIWMFLCIHTFPSPNGFLISFTTNGRTPWTSDQLVARPVPTHDTTQARPRANSHALRGTRNREPVYKPSRPAPLDRPKGRFCYAVLKQLTDVKYCQSKSYMQAGRLSHPPHDTC